VRILILSAHPDDETIGCGGTMLAHVQRGDDVHWTIVTKATPDRWAPATIRAKEAEVERVARAFGIKDVAWLGLPSTRLTDLPLNEVVDALRQVIERVRPEIVYLVHHGDVHTDHQVVANAAMIVLKAFHMRRLGVRRILAFECLSSTEAAPPFPARAFLPNVYCDITPYLERKLEIMRMFGTEVQDDPLPRGSSAIRALARVRGAAIGVEYAEAFMLVREVDA